MQRMFSRRLAGATAGLLLTATPPFAAEPLPPPPPPPVPVWTWTGFELGVQVGGGVGTTTINFLGATESYSTHGPFGGLHLGYLYQFTGSPLVIGVQGEYNFGDITGTTFNVPFRTVPLINYARTNVAEFGGFDGRVGLAFDRVLLYGIGGWVYGDIRNQIQCGLVACSPFVAVPITRDFAANRYGYDVGGGIEYNFYGNWTARAEYRYYNWNSRGFNDAGFTLVGINPFAIAIPNHREKDILHTGRIGLTYHFGEPAPPVVSKY